MQENHQSAREIKRILTAINRASAVIKKQYSQTKVDLDMTSARLNVLSAVDTLNHPTISSVARAIKSSRQNIAIIVTSMVEEDLLELKPNPQHKKSKILSITERGIRKLQRSTNQRDDVCDELCGDFDLGELQTTRIILQRLYNRLEK